MKIQTLLNLQRLLVENKFHSSDPLSINFTEGAAEVSNLVLDQIINHYKEDGDNQRAEKWVEWRELDLDRRLAIDTIVKLKEFVPEWRELDKEKRDEIIKSFFSPYIVDPDVVVERFYLKESKGSE